MRLPPLATAPHLGSLRKDSDTVYRQYLHHTKFFVPKGRFRPSHDRNQHHYHDDTDGLHRTRLVNPLHTKPTQPRRSKRIFRQRGHNVKPAF